MRISTVDAYCEEHGIQHIHVLKSDTQGFDYEVFCGADRMLSIGAVSLAYLELIMDDEYSDVDRYDSIFTLWRTEATEYKVFTARYGDTAACAGLMSCS